MVAAAAAQVDPSWMRRADDWYKGPEAAAVAANILSHQTKLGGWPKNLDTFGKGRVFGTTIGHYNEELADPVFLDMLTRGMLWACDKPVDAYLKPFDASKTKFRWEKSAETKEPPKAGSKDGK